MTRVRRQGGPLEGGAPPHTGLTPSELTELCMLFPKWNLLITVDGSPVPAGYVLYLHSDIVGKRLKCHSPDSLHPLASAL